MNSKIKVVVIGLDGACWNLIDRYIEKGELPTLYRLKNEGYYSDLKSTIPWATIPAWPSFATGLNPGEHGLFDFFRINENYEMDIELRPSHAIKKPTIWEVLGKKGKKVAVVNVPATYPPKPVNGIMITGLLTSSDNYTYPRELKNKVEKKYCYEVAFSTESGKDVEKFLKSLFRQLDQKKRLFLDLLDEDYDFIMMVDNGTDRVQHECWKFIDIENPLHDEKKVRKHRDPMLRYYKHVDKFLADVLKKLDENSTLILMSDHGQGTLHKFVNLNSFLLKEGYLKVKKNPASLLKYGLFKAGFSPKNVYNFVELFGMGRKAAAQMQTGGKMKLVNKLFFSEKDIDWCSTKAFASGVTGAIRINLKEREKRGIVKSGKEYEKLRIEIIEKLKNLKDPDNGNEIVYLAKKREEIYSGDYIEKAPDIIAATNERYEFFGMHGFSFNGIIEETFGNSGKHTPNGLYLIYNGGDKKLYDNIAITDLFNIILELYTKKIDISK